MVFVNEQMGRAVKFSRIVASMSLLASVITFVMAFASTDQAGVEQTNRAIRLIESVGILYLLPGLVLFALAWRMDAGDPWAYLVTMAVAVAAMVRVLLVLLARFSGGLQFTDDPILCEIATRVPCLYLLIACINALPHALEVYRVRRRDRRLNSRRGFEPIMPSGETSVENAAPKAKIPPRPVGIAPSLRRR